MTGKYRPKRTFQARVTRVLMKKAETKHVVATDQNIDLYHDRGTATAGALTTNQGALVFNPWVYIAKGTGANQRIGEEIYPRGMGIRLVITPNANRPATHFRVIVAVIPKTWLGVNMDGSNYDLGAGSVANDMLVNYLKVEGQKVLYDKIWRPNLTTTLQQTATYSSRIVPLFRKLYIKSKKGAKIAWKEDGSLANNPVGLWVIPYEYYGTLRTDIVATVSYSFKMYWKDV